VIDEPILPTRIFLLWNLPSLCLYSAPRWYAIDVTRKILFGLVNTSEEI
jgi:hypothetical protein